MPKTQRSPIVILQPPFHRSLEQILRWYQLLGAVTFMLALQWLKLDDNQPHWFQWVLLFIWLKGIFQLLWSREMCFEFIIFKPHTHCLANKDYLGCLGLLHCILLNVRFPSVLQWTILVLLNTQWPALQRIKPSLEWGLLVSSVIFMEKLDITVEGLC